MHVLVAGCECWEKHCIECCRCRITDFDYQHTAFCQDESVQHTFKISSATVACKNTSVTKLTRKYAGNKTPKCCWWWLYVLIALAILALFSYIVYEDVRCTKPINKTSKSWCKNSTTTTSNSTSTTSTPAPATTSTPASTSSGDISPLIRALIAVITTMVAWFVFRRHGKCCYYHGTNRFDLELDAEEDDFKAKINIEAGHDNGSWSPMDELLLNQLASAEKTKLLFNGIIVACCG